MRRWLGIVEAGTAEKGKKICRETKCRGKNAGDKPHAEAQKLMHDIG